MRGERGDEWQAASERHGDRFIQEALRLRTRADKKQIEIGYFLTAHQKRRVACQPYPQSRRFRDQGDDASGGQAIDLEHLVQFGSAMMQRVVSWLASLKLSIEYNM